MKTYPYIEEIEPDKKSRIHISEAMYIETDGCEDHTVVEHSEPTAYVKSRINFSWEYRNHHIDQIVRNDFGTIILSSSGSGRVSLPHNFLFFGSGIDPVEISKLFDHHTRYSAIREALRLEEW
jgi:hypothetical protein